VNSNSRSKFTKEIENFKSYEYQKTIRNDTFVLFQSERLVLEMLQKHSTEMMEGVTEGVTEGGPSLSAKGNTPSMLYDEEVNFGMLPTQYGNAAEEVINPNIDIDVPTSLRHVASSNTAEAKETLDMFDYSIIRYVHRIQREELAAYHTAQVIAVSKVQDAFLGDLQHRTHLALSEQEARVLVAMQKSKLKWMHSNQITELRYMQNDHFDLLFGNQKPRSSSSSSKFGRSESKALSSDEVENISMQLENLAEEIKSLSLRHTTERDSFNIALQSNLFPAAKSPLPLRAKDDEEEGKNRRKVISRSVSLLNKLKKHNEKIGRDRIRKLDSI
jgi:hypothetical protein